MLLSNSSWVQLEFHRVKVYWWSSLSTTLTVWSTNWAKGLSTLMTIVWKSGLIVNFCETTAIPFIQTLCLCGNLICILLTLQPKATKVKYLFLLFLLFFQQPYLCFFNPFHNTFTELIKLLEKSKCSVSTQLVTSVLNNNVDKCIIAISHWLKLLRHKEIQSITIPFWKTPSALFLHRARRSNQKLWFLQVPIKRYKTTWLYYCILYHNTTAMEIWWHVGSIQSLLVTNG